MADLFGSEHKITGAWKIDGAIMTIEGGEDLIVVSCTISYGRPITNYQPINKNGKVLISGTGTGGITLDSVIGPDKALKTFLERYADVCNAPGNTIVIKPAGVVNCLEGEDNNTPIEFIAGGCVLADINVAISNVGNLALVTSRLNLQINNLSIK